MNSDFLVEDQQHQGAWVVKVSGEMDILNAPRVRDHVLAGLGAITADRFVLDLAGVTFMDSAGLGLTIAVLKRTVAEKSAVAIVVGHKEVARLLTMTGVVRVYPVLTSLDEALQATLDQSA